MKSIAKNYGATCAAIAALSVNVNAAQQEVQPNIVCVVSEDNTKDYMQLFMGKRGTITPALSALAAEGVIYQNCSSNGPVSSAARSTLISGYFGPRLVSHLHRADTMVDMPDGAQMLPAYLKAAGYYTANNSKEDYNINKGDNVWDDSSKKADWANRKDGQPFYYVYNMGDTHEGQMIKSLDKLKAEVGDYQPAGGVYLQPNYPDTELFRTAYKFYCKRIEQMDAKVGAIVDRLKKEGLIDNTIILYYGDNGGIMPRSKGYLTEMGLNVPLIIRTPERYRSLVGYEAGSVSNEFVGFIDLGATILELAGVAAPKGIDGESFLGRHKGDKGLSFAYADRMGEKYDMVRTVRRGNYKYVRAFQPFNFDMLSNAYRKALPTFIELRELYDAGKLNAEQSQVFEPKSGAEMLFDLSVDPYELNDISKDKSAQKVLKELRKEMIEWQLSINDLGLYPEYYWIREAGAKTDAYGKAHKKDIAKYLKIANLQLTNYALAENSIKSALTDSDLVARYWALNVCSSFGEEASAMVPTIKAIATDSKEEPAVAARALEYLALTGNGGDINITKSFSELLYKVDEPMQAVLILNSMTLLSEGYDRLTFTIDMKRIAPTLSNHAMTKSALAKHNLKNIK